MIPAAVVFVYLAAVLSIGLFARRSSAPQADAEDFFLAGRSLGPAVFLLSLFGANMTAFSILGASGHAFSNGIVTYRGPARAGDALQVQTGRIFVVAVTVAAYLIALVVPQSIFDIATQYTFAGYSSLSPLLVAALFWKGSTRWGALAATVWTAAAVLAIAVLQAVVPAPPPGAGVSILSIGGVDVVTRAASGTTVFGLLPVVPMTIVSALLMVVVSRGTPASRPGDRTLARYF